MWIVSETLYCLAFSKKDSMVFGNYIGLDSIMKEFNAELQCGIATIKRDLVESLFL